jgi:hypothetical protein
MAQEIISLVENKSKWEKIALNELSDVSKYYSENVAKGWINIIGGNNEKE